MIPLRPFDRLKFFLERQFVRGTRYQLLVMAGLVGLISLIGGLLVWGDRGPDESVADSVWWAFLRLTDPGYLGDDEGAWRRVVSTLLTVSGYVVFMGALIAILTQWLISRMRTLEQGLTPVALKHHVVVLGWTNRTMPVLRELLMSEARVRRLLATLGRAKRLRLVVLADDLDPELTAELRNDPVTGKHFGSVILRSGSALNTDHLIRAACMQAAAIIVPARSFDLESTISSDVETIKALLSLDGQAGGEAAKLPYVVAEIQDPRKSDIARRAYRGRLEVVAGDASISRLMVQNVRHPWLSHVYIELLSHGIGNNFYLRRDDQLVGRSVAELGGMLKESVLCGVVRTQGELSIPYLNPPVDFRIAPGDAVLLIARSYQDTLRLSGGSAAAPPAINERSVVKPMPNGAVNSRRVLVMGWSRKVPALLREFSTYGQDAFKVSVVSSRPVAERVRALSEEGFMNALDACEHLEADFTSENELRDMNVQQYDSIILMSSDRMGSGEQADARSIVGYLLLEGLLAEQGPRPRLLLELSDPHNERLMGGRSAEVMISPLLLSHMLAQVALRQELRPVFDGLFSAGGPEIAFRRLQAYGQPVGSYTFQELQQAAWTHGETALGICRATIESAGRAALKLNPPRDTKLTLGPDDQLVVMMTY